MNRANLLRALLIFLAVAAGLAVGGRALARSLFPAQAAAGERIALITVEGVITADSPSGSLLGGGATGASSVAVCDQLYRARDDDSVKAVVLRVNSPGGSAAASDEIYHAIQAVSQKKKVVVSMGDVAASGGYYISSAADYIFADGATLTGSIGVIFDLMNWGDAAAKLGIKENALHAGQYKDIGSPWRPMTDDERGKIQDMLTSVHDQFIKAVAAGRKAKLDESAVRRLATGMIYTGEQAVGNGLVDELGGLRAAEDKARTLAGVGADTPVEPLDQTSLWDEVFGVDSRAQGLFQSRSPLPPAAQAVLSGAADNALGELARGLYLNATLRDMRLQ
jgi:protease-4